jgi:hypothetical protein
LYAGIIHLLEQCMKIHSIVKQFPAFMWISQVPYITDFVTALFRVVVLAEELRHENNLQDG